jgi:hypothetical protein
VLCGCYVGYEEFTSKLSVLEQRDVELSLLKERDAHVGTETDVEVPRPSPSGLI